MATRPRGSTFNIGDQGVFYNALDMGCSTAASAAANRAALITAFGTLTATGGVILVPHGVDHNFVAADFPVTTEALCLWELKGDSFRIVTNLTHTTELGQILNALRLDAPLLVKLNLVDVLTVPATYTFSLEVYDNAGSPTIAGSSFDVCWFIPGVATPVEAIARSGAVPGRHFFFKGIDVEGTARFDDAVTFEAGIAVTGDSTVTGHLSVTGDVEGNTLSGKKLFAKDIVVPVNAGSHSPAYAIESIIYNHPALIASFTLNLPSAPSNGHTIRVWSRSEITALTVAATGPDSVAAGHAITTVLAGAGFTYTYDDPTNSWYRLA